MRSAQRCPVSLVQFCVVCQVGWQSYPHKFPRMAENGSRFGIPFCVCSSAAADAFIDLLEIVVAYRVQDEKGRNAKNFVAATCVISP